MVGRSLAERPKSMLAFRRVASRAEATPMAMPSRASARVSRRMSQRNILALRPYGVALTYREFDMGHEIRPDALRVLQQWLNDKARKGE